LASRIVDAGTPAQAHGPTKVLGSGGSSSALQALSVA
jgi:hypothetical protein